MVEVSVVWDPKGDLPIGEVLRTTQDMRRIDLAQRRGVVLLPCDTSQIDNPLSGIPFVRHWGKGWVFDQPSGRRACPMLNFVKTSMQTIFWAARLVPIDASIAGPQGILRLVTSTGIIGTINGTIGANAEPVTTSELGDPDQFGGWTVRGKAIISSTMDGYLATSLYGACTGFRVAWSAASVV